MSPDPKVPLDPVLLSRARAMRHDAAPAEQKLWAFLRGRRFCGLKFRRQVPLQTFIADFYCHDLNLVVELDGGTHYGREAHDEARTEILIRDGHHVVRFLNIDVFEHLDAVLQALLDECERLRESKQHTPSPSGRGRGLGGVRRMKAEG